MKSRARPLSPSCIVIVPSAERLREVEDTPSTLWYRHINSRQALRYLSKAKARFRLICSVVSCNLLVVAQSMYCNNSMQFVVHSRMGCIWSQGISETFSATGTENVSIYRAPMKQHDPKADLAGNMRHFCKVYCKNADHSGCPVLLLCSTSYNAL